MHRAGLHYAMPVLHSNFKIQKKELCKNLNLAPLVSSAVDSSTSYRRFEDSTSDDSSGSSLSKFPNPEPKGEGGNEEEEEDGELPYHTINIVIDCAPIGFADSMGITDLEQMVREHDEVGIQVLLAAPPTPLCKALIRHGFFKRFGSECLFPTVTSAVSFARVETKWLD